MIYRVCLLIIPLICVGSARFPRAGEDDLARPTKEFTIYAPNGRNFVSNTINVKRGAVSFTQADDDADHDVPNREGYRSGKQKVDRDESPEEEMHPYLPEMRRGRGLEEALAQYVNQDMYRDESSEEEIDPEVKREKNDEDALRKELNPSANKKHHSLARYHAEMRSGRDMYMDESSEEEIDPEVKRDKDALRKEFNPSANKKGRAIRPTTAEDIQGVAGPRSEGYRSGKQKTYRHKRLDEEINPYHDHHMEMKRNRKYRDAFGHDGNYRSGNQPYLKPIPRMGTSAAKQITTGHSKPCSDKVYLTPIPRMASSAVRQIKTGCTQGNDRDAVPSSKGYRSGSQKMYRDGRFEGEMNPYHDYHIKGPLITDQRADRGIKTGCTQGNDRDAVPSSTGHRSENQKMYRDGRFEGEMDPYHDDTIPHHTGILIKAPLLTKGPIGPGNSMLSGGK